MEYQTIGLAVLALLLPSCLPALGKATNVRTNHEGAVIVHKGESVDLICSSDNDIKTCNFISASGQFMSFCPNASYPRIERVNEGNSSICGIRISNIIEQDSGVWRCRFFSLDKEGEDSHGTADINVTVASCNQGYQCTATCVLVESQKWLLGLTSNPDLKSLLSEEIESLRCEDPATGDEVPRLEKFCCPPSLAKQTEWSECINGRQQRVETQTCVTNIPATSTTGVNTTINTTTTGTVSVCCPM